MAVTPACTRLGIYPTKSQALNPTTKASNKTKRPISPCKFFRSWLWFVFSCFTVGVLVNHYSLFVLRHSVFGLRYSYYLLLAIGYWLFGLQNSLFVILLPLLSPFATCPPRRTKGYNLPKGYGPRSAGRVMPHRGNTLWSCHREDSLTADIVILN